jgi:hypothetical protein
MCLQGFRRVLGEADELRQEWISPINGRTFPVPRSNSPHTANEVLKQAGLPKQF